MSNATAAAQTEGAIRTPAIVQAMEARSLIEMSSQMARRGYGEPVIELALRRKGLRVAEARLIAASVVSCHLSICAAQAQATPSRVRTSPQGTGTDADLRAARAARHALGQMMSFFVYIVIGIGGGLLLGWNFGFGRGVEDGYDWILRALELMAAR